MTFVLFSVVLFSFIITLCTNVIVNIPLHYFFLRMGINIRLNSLFTEFTEQFREYQYKTQSMDTYNKESNITKQSLTSIFGSNLYNDYSGESSTSCLLKKDNDNNDESEKDLENRKSNLLDSDYYNTYNIRHESNDDDDNNNQTDTNGNDSQGIIITKKLNTLINKIMPKEEQHQEHNDKEEEINNDNLIDINIIENNNSITNKLVFPDIIVTNEQNSEQHQKEFEVITHPNLLKPIINKDSNNNFSTSSFTSLFIGNVNDKELNESIENLNNTTNNIYEKPIEKSTQTAENDNKNSSDRAFINIHNYIGSNFSINNSQSLSFSQQQEQQIQILKRTKDFTKIDFNIKEENINEGIYKYYAKTISDIESKINQLQHIKFKHTIQVALKKAFHPFLFITFAYNIYMIYAIYLILNRIWDWDPMTSIFNNGATLQEAGLIPNSSFFQWNSSSGFKFHWLIWINIILNYLPGAILPILYWLSVILYNISSIKKRKFFHHINSK